MAQIPSPKFKPLPVYAGNCSLCGARAEFVGRPNDWRNSFPCPSCGATHRYREQAAAILTLFARGENHFLSRSIRQDWHGRAILEYAQSSPFTASFAQAADYQRAWWFEGVTQGAMRGGVCCQNLARLTYPDARFDLLVTSDVMQNLPDIEQVIGEVARVLRPGGAHVFSVPLHFPLAARSTLGQELDAGSTRREARRTVNTFGIDLIDMHARHGLHVRFLRGEPLLGLLRDNAVIVARKLP